MSEKLKGYLVDLRDGSAEQIEFVDELEELYKLTNCDCIDITVRKVGDFEFDIVCDDEGMLKEKVIPTACDSERHPMLVGNLLFCQHDEEGNLASLTDEQVKCLEEHTGHYLFDNGHWLQLVPVIDNMEYC